MRGGRPTLQRPAFGTRVGTPIRASALVNALEIHSSRAKDHRLNPDTTVCATPLGAPTQSGYTARAGGGRFRAEAALGGPPQMMTPKFPQLRFRLKGYII